MLPAVGQGALAVEARANDAATRARLAPLEHPETRICATAERALLRRLQGGCQVPIAAHAVLVGEKLTLRALVASLDGSRIVRTEHTGHAHGADAIGEKAGEEILSQGGAEILGALGGMHAEVPQP
jgi:hydroxymethylbilane synthase